MLPFFKKMSNGFCSFAYAAPLLCNQLPNNVFFAYAHLFFRKTLKHISLAKHFLLILFILL